MRIVKLKGGLGNQMFQYAFAKLLEKETGDIVKLDFSAYKSLKKDIVRVPRLARFSLSLPEVELSDLKLMCLLSHTGNSQSFFYKVGIFIEKTINPKYFWEPTRAYRNIKELLQYAYYDGYWQSYKYVYSILDDIRKEFVSKQSLSCKTLSTIEKIKSQNAVFLGIRRGDYLDNITHYGSFSEKYYLKAMKKMEYLVENPVFYIFSNDIEWVKNNITWDNHNVVFREVEDQTDDFEELMIMASCKHAIIINSTYHWWGATLISNLNKIVICPEKWFFDDKPIDIIPPEWIRQKDI